MRINYTVVECSLGFLLVAATARGVCAAGLGDTGDDLETGLRADYPTADVARSDNDLSAWAAALTACLEGQTLSLDLPLDVRASAFQQLVWRVLRAIPPGETRSYSAIARAVGHPKAARAVGQACASNPVALVIPCHRAVREDGSLGGYRWGLARKEALLKREAELRSASRYV